MKRLITLVAGLLLLVAGVALLPTILGKLFPTGKVAELAPGPASNDMPVVVRTNGGLLEVATVKHRRTFSLPNAMVIFGQKVPFCKETATYTVDANFTYRVRLARRWRGEVDHGALYITAPKLEPAIPVAFDTANLASSLDACRLFPNMDTKDELLRSISTSLADEARSSKYIDFVRDHARATVREFVGKWMLSQRDYNLPQGTRIEVAFADEG